MAQHIFEFADMAKSGLKTAKAIGRLFAKAGAPLAGDPVIDPRLRRTSGVTYREVTLLFKDSQKIVLRVKQTGDIWQVLQNGRDIPLKNHTDQVAAVKEIVSALNAKRKAFQKRLTMNRAPIKERGLTVTRKMLAQKLKDRSATLSQLIEEAQTELDELIAERTPKAAETAPKPAEEAAPAPAPEPAPVQPGPQPTPEPTPQPVPEPTPSPNPELEWLNGVASGAIDISKSLDKARDRIRAAQKNPELAGAAMAAADALKAAALAEAQRIIAKGKKPATVDSVALDAAGCCEKCGEKMTDGKCAKCEAPVTTDAAKTPDDQANEGEPSGKENEAPQKAADDTAESKDDKPAAEKSGDKDDKKPAENEPAEKADKPADEKKEEATTDAAAAPAPEAPPAAAV